MDRAPTKVVYLVGTSRCGSTLVGALLGNMPGVIHVGELWRIWEEGLVHNFRCGCGDPVGECKFWSTVLDRAFDGARVDPRRMMALTDRWGRLRHARHLATERGRDRVRAGMAEYGDAMARLYRAIGEVSGASIVLDTSKVPMLAWVLAGQPDVDLRILHVTRDPRAVAYSWQRRKTDPAKGQVMYRESGTVVTSLRWLAWNGLAAALWERPAPSVPYLLVRYEDLTLSPQPVLDRICQWLGEPARGDSLVDRENRYTSAPGHTVAGNPIRFERGKRRIAADVAWQDEASSWNKLLVSGLTWPLLGKYHYPLRPTSRQVEK